MDSDPTDSLVNLGLARINDADPGDTATVIVVGLPRSGTSMIASVLKSLGLFIGSQLDNVVFEDHEIAAALDSQKSERLGRLIERRNNEHAKWGFKRPEAYKQLDALCAACRHPRVIVPFRDIMAIALRNKISMQIDPVKFLPRLARDYDALVGAIKKVSAPCLLISYEKALQYPDKTVADIAAFCGIEADDEQIAAASDIVENGNTRYVQATRLRYEGFVGRVVNGLLRGWVKVKARDEVRVTVDFELDGAVVASVRADIYRPDVEKAGFGDGRYGFEFAISDEMNRDGIVNIRVQNSKILLKNSGLPLSKY